MIRGIIFVFFVIFSIPTVSPQVENSEDKSLIVPPVIEKTEEGDTIETENLDDLFSNPPADTVATVLDQSHREDFEKFDKIKYSGSFSANAGIAAGWVNWPDFNKFDVGFDASAGASASATFNFDARPNPVFRVNGTVTSSLDPMAGSKTWSEITLSQLFCDYIFQDFIFIRLGHHTMSWGQGRLFNPGNFMSDSSSSLSMRAVIPSWLSGVSFSALAYDSIKSYKQLAAALKTDIVIGNLLVSPGLKYRDVDGLKGLLSLKTTVWHVDLLLDSIITYKESAVSYAFLGGFFREWNNFVLYGEYYGKLEADSAYLQDVGLVMAFNNIFGTSMDCALKWFHCISDSSGSVLGGITWTPWKLIKISIGIPIYYGREDGIYIMNNPDPSDRKISLALLVELAGSF